MKKSLKFFVFSFVPLICLILAAELVCRLKFYYLHDHDIQYLIAPFGKLEAKGTPRLIKVRNCAEDTLIYSQCRNKLMLRSFNDYCWRGKPFTVEKPDSIFRILVVGGSTVLSVDNADEDTWTAQLDEKLNSAPEAQIRFEVINAGQSGYNSRQIDSLLVVKGYPLKPDMVVYYEAINETRLVTFKFNDLDTRIGLIAHSSIGWLHKMLHYNSMLYTYLVEKYFFTRMGVNNWNIDENQTQENFRRIIKQCKERNVGFVYVRQVIDYPIAKDGLNLTDGGDIRKLLEQLESKNLSGEPKPQLSETWNEIRALLQRLIVLDQTSVCEEENIPVIDPLPAFDLERNGPVKLFSDICHTTCYGDKILADCIYQGVRPGAGAMDLH